MHMSVTIAAVRNISGSKERPDGTSRPYDFDVVTGLVDGLDAVELRIGADQRAGIGTLMRGDVVDLEVTPARGAQFDVLRALPAPASAPAKAS